MFKQRELNRSIGTMRSLRFIALLPVVLLLLMAMGIVNIPACSGFYLTMNHMSRSKRNGKTLGGRWERSLEREKTLQNPNKIMIGNLDFNVSSPELEKWASRAGDVVSTKIVRDQYTKRSKGYAFVEYSAPLEATCAIEELHGAVLRGRRVDVNNAFTTNFEKAVYRKAKEQRLGVKENGAEGGNL